MHKIELAEKQARIDRMKNYGKNIKVPGKRGASQNRAVEDTNEVAEEVVEERKSFIPKLQDVETNIVK